MDVGNGLPQLMTEREAAAALRVKQPTIRAERIRGRLGFIRIGARIFYTLEQLFVYLERPMVSACANNEPNTQVKLENTGSASMRSEPPPATSGAYPTGPSGAGRGDRERGPLSGIG